MFTSFVLPIFRYGILLYMHSGVADRAMLERLYRKCGRFALRDNSGIPKIANLYSELATVPLRFHFQTAAALLMYDIVMLHRIPGMDGLFTPAVGGRDLRSKSNDGCVNLVVPFARSALAQTSVVHWGARLWNSIPREIRSVSSRDGFQTMYSLHMCRHLANYTCDEYNLYDFV